MALVKTKTVTKNRKECAPSSSSCSNSWLSDTQLRTMIENKAYELFLKRGCNHGNDLTDWLEAERLVKQQM